MQSYRLTRLRTLLLALLAVFAFGAISAAAAQAEEAPFWTVPAKEGSSETKRLAANETRFITAKTYNKTTLESPSLEVTVTCPTVELKEGVLLGSNAGEPGKNDEIVEFKGGCTQTGNGTSCKVTEPITTEHVKSELVENVENGAVGKKLLTEFFPETGAKFAEVKFTGTCTKTKDIAVEGKVAAEVRGDPNKPPELGEIVELPNRGKVAKSWLLNFPATPIKEVWLIKAGAGKAEKVGLSAATEPLVFSGAILVLLANSKRETVEENWSPLP
jgi:hypothetical protein